MLFLSLSRTLRNEMLSEKCFLIRHFYVDPLATEIRASERKFLNWLCDILAVSQCWENEKRSVGRWWFLIISEHLLRWFSSKIFPPSMLKTILNEYLIAEFLLGFFEECLLENYPSFAFDSPNRSRLIVHLMLNSRDSYLHRCEHP